MVWKTGAGHSLTLTRAPSDTARPASADLTALRNYARARARQRGSDILSVDPIVTARGAQAIEVIAKRTYGGGFWFEGTLVVSDPDMDYT